MRKFTGTDDLMIGYAEVKDDKYWYTYVNGCFIYKKPLTARYSCSIDIELMIAENINNRKTS